MTIPRIQFAPKRFMGIFLIILLVVQSCIILLQSELSFLEEILKSGFQRSDSISEYEARFDGLKEILPPNSVVRYITSKNISGDQATYHYFLTQYVLSPVIIDNSTMHRLVIGSFPDPKSPVEMYETNNLVLIMDYGNGVALFGAKEAE